MNNQLTYTQKVNIEALKTKAMLEKLLESGEFAECLREELTRLYFINNLMLITSLN